MTEVPLGTEDPAGIVVALAVPLLPSSSDVDKAGAPLSAGDGGPSSSSSESESSSEDPAPTVDGLLKGESGLSGPSSTSSSGAAVEAALAAGS